jgi:hypothetical protein
MQPISASPSPAYDFQGWSKGLLDSISFDSSSSASTYAWIYGAGTITANFVLIASITNIQRPNTAYQQGNTAEVQVFVENTGTVSHSYKTEFFIIGPIGTTKGPYRASGIVMYYESSPGGTTIVSQIIEPGQTGMALMEWLVPQDALAGSYSLEVYVYEYNPILQQEGVFIRSKSELYLFSVDQGYSYSESYTFAFGAKGIHIHVSEEDMNSPVIYGISTSNYLWTSRILGLALVVLDPFAPDLPFAWMNAISIIMNLNDAYLSGQDFGTVIAVGDNGADFLILQFLTLPSAFFYQHDFVWLMNIYHWPDPGIFILFDFTSVTVPGYWIWELPSSTFTISVSAGANGQITPGTGLVNYGSTPTYSITPNTGYHIASITVNGGSVAVTSPKGQSYQFAPVTSAGSIAATFAVDLPSTVIFEDGFESGSFSAWVLPSLTTDETRNIVSNPIHDGSFAAQFSSNGNGGTERAYAYKTISSVNELYSRAYIRVSTFGLVENDDRFYLVIFRAGGASVAFAGWRVVGGVVRWNLIIRHGTGWVNAYSTTTPVLDQWYSVELHWVGDAVAGLGELYVNGVLVCSATGRNTAYYGSASRVDFGLPEIINCAATEVYVDCCAISDSYIGPESAIVPKVATPTFSPAGGTYSSAQLIVIQCATSSATIRYTTDDIEPSSSSTIYSSPILVASTTTIKAKAFKNDMPDSDTATATYTISSSIFEDGFESGSFSAWSLPSLTTGESRNVISSPVHDGSYAAEFASNGNGGTERSYVYTSISSVNELHSRAYIRVSTFGLVENDDRFYLVIFRAGGASVAFAGWRVVGGVVRWNLIIRHGTGWVNAYSTTTPVLDQWYSVELHWVGDAVAGLGELWVDGVNVCSASGRNTAYYGNVNQVWVGLPEIINCAATQIYIDCTVISANYIGLESGPTQVSVNLESLQDTSATSNLGSIVFDVLSYTLPNNVLKTLSSFSVTYVPAGGYLFDHWEVAGGISVENSLSQTTMATVSSAGTLRAIYRIVSSSAIFEDGFESGSFSAWTLPTLTTGETRSVVNTIVYDGSYAGQFSSNGNGGTERAYVYKTFAAQNELYVSGSFRVAASGLIENDDRFYVIAIKSDSGVVAFAGWRVVGGVAKWNLVVRHGTGWVNVYSSVNPVLNQWYDLQLHWKSDATNGLGELYVNGVLVCSSIGKNTANYGSATRVDFGLPELVNCGATEVYGDTCKVSVTPT